MRFYTCSKEESMMMTFVSKLESYPYLSQDLDTENEEG